VGFLDIEATNLKATFGIVICWCIKPNKAKKIIEASITPKDLRDGVWDKRVLEELLRVLAKFDRVVVHYGSRHRFDTPYLRSRCLHHGLKFPGNKELWVSDTYPIAKAALCLHSNRLGTIADFLHIKTKKTAITTDHWLGALSGNRKSLDYILDHCRRDVLILEKVWNQLEPHHRLGRTSI
jgi:uncharacterized protein YprB with RNaseH-like and TPR domain